MQTLWQDLRYGARMLFKQPGFTLIAVLTLALGIGATTAIFSVVYATLFEAMPYPKPEQLVMVWTQRGTGRTGTSTGDLLAWRERSQSFQYLEAWNGGLFNVATPERPQQVAGVYYTPGFFQMTGYPMMLGRGFTPEEGEIGKERVVILSHRFWQKHFGGNRELIGQQVRMNGEPYTVIGVAAPGLNDRFQAQLWVPWAWKPEQINHEMRSLAVMGRLKDGVTLAQAQAEMQGITRQLAQEHPNTNANLNVTVEPLQNNFIPPATIKNLWMLLGAVSFLLLMACVNVANLSLARATTRLREVAIRMAVGATRARLFRLFLTESLLLSVAGGIAGTLLSLFLIDAIIALVPMNMLPSEADIRLSLPVLWFTLAVALVAGLLFGCAPAWQASRLDLNEVMKQGGRAGVQRSGLRRALVVVEFALALTLLGAGSLALHSFWNLTRVDLGVRTERVLTFFLPLPEQRFADVERLTPYYRQLLEKIRAVPGVEQATITGGIPTRGMPGRPFTLAGAPPIDPKSRPSAGFMMVTPAFFDTFGVRTVKGRNFTEDDTAGRPRVAMVNEEFVARFLAGVDPLAQRLVIEERVPGNPTARIPVEWQIVGVFHNVRNGHGLRNNHAEIYAPFWQQPHPQAAFAVRTAGDPASVVKSLAAAVNAHDPDVPLAGVKTIDEHVSEVLAFDQFSMVLYASFAVLALLLAAVGIYGVMAFAVAARTQEFGVRLALGASGQRILRMVLLEAATLAAGGLVIGLGGAYLVGRAMQAALYGVGAFDVAAFGASAVLLLLTALLACYVPARRAGRIDPLIALRCE